MTLEQLFDRAWSKGIDIDVVPLRELRAVAFPEGWIAIDSSKYDSDVDLKCDCAHEIGHCETGSFYNINTPKYDKSKCEYKADKRAIAMLMPYEDVKQALCLGYITPWAMADYFDVTQDFAEKALALYHDRLHGYDEFGRT